LLFGKCLAADAILQNGNGGGVIFDDERRCGARRKLFQNGLRNGGDLRHACFGRDAWLKEYFDDANPIVRRGFDVLNIIHRGGKGAFFGIIQALFNVPGRKPGVTERKLSEALLSSEKHLLEMIAGGAPLPAVLNDLCSAIDEQSPGLISTVLSLDAEGQKLWPVAGPGVPQGWTRMVSPLAIGPCAGSCGTAAYRKEPVVVSDIATDPLWADFREGALSYGLKACWSKPIMSTTGSVLGTFATYYGEIRDPGKRDLLLIERAT
jgi:hypothetical protein